MKTVVILIHGLGGSRIDMWPLENSLRQAGFHVINWRYRSIGTSIQSHVTRMHALIEGIQANESVNRIHIVGHSMGGIIVRALLCDKRMKQKLTKLHRVIQLASPNRGSRVARLLAPWIGWLVPAIKQLSDEENSFVNQLDNPLKGSNIEFATVEASEDRVVPADSVQLEGQKDFAKMQGHHGFMPWYSEAIRLVQAFLETGEFGKVQHQVTDKRWDNAACPLFRRILSNSWNITRVSSRP